MATIEDLDNITYADNVVVDGTISGASFWNVPILNEIKSAINNTNDIIYDEFIADRARITALETTTATNSSYLNQDVKTTGNPQFNSVILNGGEQTNMLAAASQLYVNQAIAGNAIYYEITDPSVNGAVSAAIVTSYSGVIITTTTTGSQQTLQNPTTGGKKFFTVANSSSSTNTVEVQGELLEIGKFVQFYWGGTDWILASYNGNRLYTTSTNPGVNEVGATSIVDVYDGNIVTLTTTANAQTLQDPTNTTAGKHVFTVVNNDTSTNNLTVDSIIIEPGQAHKFIYDGTAWIPVNSIDASDITNIPNGNIIATNVQDAIDELDGQDTTIQGNLTTHEGLSIAHGTIGTIVGTSDTQTLTNKTLASLSNFIHADGVHFTVRSTSGTIARGKPLKIDSVVGGVLYVSMSTNSDITIGFSGQVISDSVDSGAIVTGTIANVDTSGYSVGDVLWSTAVAGVMTNVQPEADGRPLAVVFKADATTGVIEVNAQLGFQGYEFSSTYKTYADQWIDIQDTSPDPSGFNRYDLTSLPIIELCHSAASGTYRRIEPDSTHTLVTGATYFGDGTTSLADNTVICRYSSGSSFYYFVNGIKVTKTTTQSVEYSTAATGIRIIYFSNGTLTDSDGSNFQTILYEGALVAILYYNKTNDEVNLLADERHGMLMSAATHAYEHDTFGARYASGFDIIGLADGSGTYTQTNSGIIFDEDIKHNFAVQTTNPFLYMLGAGAEWNWTTADLNVSYNGGGNAYYNEYTGGAWQLTEVPNGDYTIVHFIATNDSQYPVVKILGQAAYAKRNAARAAIETEISNIQLLGLPTPEFIFLYSIIVTDDNLLENLADGSTYVDFRGGLVGAGGASVSVTNHQDLVGLQGGTTAEYYHLTQAQHDDLVTSAGQDTDFVLYLHGGKASTT